MKKLHIIGIVIIACMISVIVSSAGDASRYVNFEEAQKIAKEDGESELVHVVGSLPRNAQGEALGIQYDPLIDPNYIAFEVIDESKKTVKVISYSPPASIEDFKRSEKVVMVGGYKKGQFVAKEILLKCPSKYEEKQIKEQ